MTRERNGYVFSGGERTFVTEYIELRKLKGRVDGIMAVDETCLRYLQRMLPKTGQAFWDDSGLDRSKEDEAAAQAAAAAELESQSNAAGQVYPAASVLECKKFGLRHWLRVTYKGQADDEGNCSAGFFEWVPLHAYVGVTSSVAFPNGHLGVASDPVVALYLDGVSPGTRKGLMEGILASEKAALSRGSKPGRL